MNLRGRTHELIDAAVRADAIFGRNAVGSALLESAEYLAVNWAALGLSPESVKERHDHHPERPAVQDQLRKDCPLGIVARQTPKETQIGETAPHGSDGTSHLKSGEA
jgi:hypothetical protein